MGGASKEPVFREPYGITFEVYLVHSDVLCDVAYGMLKIGGAVLPALRHCIRWPVHPFAVKVYGSYAAKVEKAPYFLQVPPHRYITFTDAPDVLLLMKPGGGAAVLLCNLSAEACAKLHDARADIYDEDDAWTLIRRIAEADQRSG